MYGNLLVCSENVVCMLNLRLQQLKYISQHVVGRCGACLVTHMHLAKNCGLTDVDFYTSFSLIQGGASGFEANLAWKPNRVNTSCAVRGPKRLFPVKGVSVTLDATPENTENGRKLLHSSAQN